MTIGEQLRKTRLLRDLTLKDVSERTGIYVSDLSKYENDIKTMSVQSLARILDALGARMSIRILGCDSCLHMKHCNKESGRSWEKGCANWRGK